MHSNSFKYKNAKIEQMFPSATIAAQFVKQKMPECKKVYYIGMEPMGDELRSSGLEVIGGTKGDPEHEKSDDYFRYDEIKDYFFDPEVGAVI